MGEARYMGEGGASPSWSLLGEAFTVLDSAF